MVAPRASAHAVIFWVSAVLGRAEVSEAPTTATDFGRKNVSRSRSRMVTGRPVMSVLGAGASALAFERAVALLAGISVQVPSSARAGHARRATGVATGVPPGIVGAPGDRYRI